MGAELVDPGADCEGETVTIKPRMERWRAMLVSEVWSEVNDVMSAWVKWMVI